MFIYFFITFQLAALVGGSTGGVDRACQGFVMGCHVGVPCPLRCVSPIAAKNYRRKNEEGKVTEV